MSEYTTVSVNQSRTALSKHMRDWTLRRKLEWFEGCLETYLTKMYPSPHDEKRIILSIKVLYDTAAKGRAHQ